MAHYDDEQFARHRNVAPDSLTGRTPVRFLLGAESGWSGATWSGNSNCLIGVVCGRLRTVAIMNEPDAESS